MVLRKQAMARPSKKIVRLDKMNIVTSTKVEMGQAHVNSINQPYPEHETNLRCEVCGGTICTSILSNLEFIYMENNSPATWTYSLVRCSSCGLVFITPKPFISLLPSFYEKSYGNYDCSNFDPIEETGGYKYRIAKWRFANYKGISVLGTIQVAFAYMVQFLTGRTISYTLGVPLQFDKNACIMDVGFGTGAWLLGMSHLGYRNLHGYDIDCNKENIERLRKTGINVNTGDFLSNHYPDGLFDLIRLEHVFEHLLSPEPVLAKIFRLLKPSGVLVMNFPGSNGFDFLVSPKHCVSRDSPRHLFLHTKRSAEKIVLSAGFGHLSIREYPVPINFFTTLQLAGGAKKTKVILCLSRILWPFYRILSRLFQKGDYITLIATK
jgi:SAM-dependent methyltransferase